MADELNQLLAGALNTEANAAASWHDPEAMALAARRAIARKRIVRSLAIGGAGLVAAASVGAVLTLGGGFRDDAVVPASPSATTTPTPSASTTTSLPSPTASAAIKDWATVPEADKPPVIADQNPAEPKARKMADWVWAYVDDGWKLWVFTEHTPDGFTITSQALFLEAPNGDQFRLSELGIDAEMNVNHWDARDKVAWIARCPGGDTCWVVQTDLVSGRSDPNWGDGAIPQRAVSPGGVAGVANATFVAALPSGDELWSVDTYLGTYDGFFLRSADGHFRTIAGESAIDGAIASGAANNSGYPGIEAWVTADHSYAIVLLQWPIPGDSSDLIVHTSQAQWVVINLRDNKAKVSDAFVPVPPLCGAATGLVPGTGSTPPATVTADCGGSTYALVPLTAQATKVSG